MKYVKRPIHIRPDYATIMVHEGGMMTAKVEGCKEQLRISGITETHWIHEMTIRK